MGRWLLGLIPGRRGESIKFDRAGKAVMLANCRVTQECSEPPGARCGEVPLDRTLPTPANGAKTRYLNGNNFNTASTLDGTI